MEKNNNSKNELKRIIMEHYEKMQTTLKSGDQNRIAYPEGYEKVFTHFYFAKNNKEETITKRLIP